MVKGPGCFRASLSWINCLRVQHNAEAYELARMVSMKQYAAEYYQPNKERIRKHKAEYCICNKEPGAIRRVQAKCKGRMAQLAKELHIKYLTLRLCQSALRIIMLGSRGGGWCYGLK